MGHTAPRNQDASIGGSFVDASESLALALQAIAGYAGYEIDRDGVNAVLGLSWSAVAVPFEDDLARWPMYARDAFLIETGRLFGMTIRDIHPPEAARGLRGTAEFSQHFEASYRPLILRALENNQPVLAWQGWPGDRQMMWGIITGPCDGGVGFAGWVAWPNAHGLEARATPDGLAPASCQWPMPSPQARHSPLILARPPVQLYVVETVVPTTPTANALRSAALDHVRQVLDNALEDRFDVLTGPVAYDAWIDRLRTAVPHPSGSPEGWGTDMSRPVIPPPLLRKDGAPAPGDAARSRLLEGHRLLTASVIAGHQSAVRFLDTWFAGSTNRQRAAAEKLTDLCRIVIRSMEEAVAPAALNALRKSPSAWTKVRASIAKARDATKEMLSARVPWPNRAPP